jgi:hypothetical protein
MKNLIVKPPFILGLMFLISSNFQELFESSKNPTKQKLFFKPKNLNSAEDITLFTLHKFFSNFSQSFLIWSPSHTETSTQSINI